MMIYRQILIREEDKDRQIIIWREEPDAALKKLKLNTLTYETSCAPFLSIRGLNQLPEEEDDEYPLANRALQHDFYMEDVLAGTDTKKETTELQQKLKQLLERAKFDLRKWRANHIHILAHLSDEGKPNDILLLNTDESLKTLGLFWNSLTDSIDYKVKEFENQRVTKRRILSWIS